MESQEQEEELVEYDSEHQEAGDDDRFEHLRFMSGEELAEAIYEAYTKDTEAAGLVTALHNGDRQYRNMHLADYSLQGDRVYYRGKLWVPGFGHRRTEVIKANHQSLGAGHGGRKKTLDLVCRGYPWIDMHTDVARYVQNCIICRRVKSSNDKFHGLLKPLPPPERRWQHFSMNYITGLPPRYTADEHLVTNVLVVVDRLSKMRHFIVCSDMSAAHTARMFKDQIWKLHGLPESIVSDRGAQSDS